jgi:hypothetical protein
MQVFSQNPLAKMTKSSKLSSFCFPTCQKRQNFPLAVKKREVFPGF